MRVPVIVGPTAVGKTAVAVELAASLGGEIISADSRQVYRGMEIGTGAPEVDILKRVRHHLVGVVEPERRLSAGVFADRARRALGEIIARGRVPLVVGGSGLYIRALVDGLAPIPDLDPEAVRRVEREVDRRGMPAMLAELAKVDPRYASKVGPRDRKRLVRALVVQRVTGRSFSEWHAVGNGNRLENPVIIGLTRPRGELWGLIEKRVRAMMDRGWVGELKALAEKYGGLNRLPAPVVEALGYRQLIQYLRREISLETAVEQIVIATRRFAKRQMTWFRADERVMWNRQSGPSAVMEWVEWTKSVISPMV